MTASGTDWLRARERAIGRLRRHGWRREDAEDAASEALVALLPGGLYSGSWWYMWRIAERMLRQQPRGSRTAQTSRGRRSSVAPRAGGAMRSGEELLDPGTWITDHVAAQPEPPDLTPRDTAHDLAYLAEVVGLTTREIASRVGCTQRAICNWATTEELRRPGRSRRYRDAIAVLAEGYRATQRTDRRPARS